MQAKIYRHVMRTNNEYTHRAVARALIGGGGVYSYIVLCPTNFF